MHQSPATGHLRFFSGAMIRRGAIALLATLSVSGSMGCYGSFPLTNAVYNWNGRATDNHIVNSIIMIVLAIIPVYGICILVDALIINSISYWSGNEVVISQKVEQPDGSVAELAPGDGPGKAVLTVTKDGAELTRVYFERDANMRTEARDAEGNLLATIQLEADGSLTLAAADGSSRQTINADQLAMVLAAK